MKPTFCTFATLRPILLILFLLLTIEGKADPYHTRTRIYPRLWNQVMIAAEACPGGGYLVSEVSMDRRTLRIIRINPDGSLGWKCDSLPNQQEWQSFYAVQPVAGGGVVVTGSRSRDYGYAAQYSDSCQELIWQHNYSCWAYNSCEPYGDGWILSAHYGDYARVEMLSASGSLVSSFNCGHSIVAPVHIREYLQDGFIVATSMYTSLPHGPIAPLAIRMRSNGDTIWTHCYENLSGSFWGCSVLSDGGILFTTNYGRILRTDSTGVPIWTGSTTLAVSYSSQIAETEMGELIFGGRNASGGFVLARLTAGGEQNWIWSCDLLSSSASIPAVCITNQGRFTYFQRGAHLIECTEGIAASEFCLETADACTLEQISGNPVEYGFRITHQSGLIDRLVFARLSPGAQGRVEGNAADTWSVLPNGDGNNGDSVVFVTDIPLTNGYVDTLFLQPSDTLRCASWSTGCAGSDIALFSANTQVAEFEADAIGDSVHFHLRTEVESAIYYWMISRASSENWTLCFDSLTSFSPSNSYEGNEYTFSVSELSPWLRGYLLTCVDSAGQRVDFTDRIVWIGTINRVAETTSGIAASFHLIATPNPFNPYTTISFALPHPAHARLTVYDVLGREVRVLANDNFAPGEHRLRFDGSDLPSGIYFARLQSGEFVATQKLLLLK